MKKFLALCLSFCLSLSIFSVPTLAADQSQLITPNSAEQNSEDEGISPHDLTLLWSTDGLWFITSYPVRVTPDKGTNLKMIFGASDTCKIEVTKDGGWWPSKTITYEAGSGTQTYDLINNCNGGTYTIKFINSTGVTIVARVVQAEYI